MSKHLGNILEPAAAHGGARGRRAALVHGLHRVAVGRPPDRAEHAARDRPQGAADLLEHRRVPLALRAGRGVDARRRCTGARRPPDHGPLGAGRARRRRHRRDRRARAVRRATGGSAAGDVRRRPVELVRPPVAAPVLGRRPVRARDAAHLPRDADPAARPDHAVRHRAGVAGRGPAGHHRRCRVGAPGVVADRRARRRAPRAAPTPTCPAHGAGPPTGRARSSRPGRVRVPDPSAPVGARW